MVYNGKKNVIEIGNLEYLSLVKVKGQISRINNNYGKAGSKCKNYTQLMYNFDVSKINQYTKYCICFIILILEHCNEEAGRLTR